MYVWNLVIKSSICFFIWFVDEIYCLKLRIRFSTKIDFVSKLICCFFFSMIFLSQIESKNRIYWTAEFFFYLKKKTEIRFRTNDFSLTCDTVANLKSSKVEYSNEFMFASIFWFILASSVVTFESAFFLSNWYFSFSLKFDFCFVFS